MTWQFGSTFAAWGLLWSGHCILTFTGWPQEGPVPCSQATGSQAASEHQGASFQCGSPGQPQVWRKENCSGHCNMGLREQGKRRLESLDQSRLEPFTPPAGTQ